MSYKAVIQPPVIHYPRFTVVKGKIRPRNMIDERGHYLVIKRVIDVLFSALFITGVLSWLVPLVAILIKLDSEGPVFFRQKRTGKGGRSFYCFKFRSISNGPVPRITALGRFLRNSNIDEFPQFWNVLVGSMTLIGPRPHMHADCNRFAQLLPDYKLRNLVKPGITGMAQVKGFHGTVTSKYSAMMRFHWDQYYISNMCLLLDAKIFALTVAQRAASLVRLLFPGRAEGCTQSIQ